MWNLLSKGKNTSLKVIITGEPRSGTSFLSGYISRLGFNLGHKKNIKGPDKNNRHGYFEHRNLMQVSKDILIKLKGDFHWNIPILNEGWIFDFVKERNKIAKIVNKENIEMYKGNRLMVLADMYSHLYPDAKWIKIERNIEETYISRFGERIPFADYKRITELRSEAWERSETSKNALVLNYDMFKSEPERTFETIVKHLKIECSDQQRQECIDFFKPKIRK